MHPRNPYAAAAPDYEQLALVVPELQPHLKRTAAGSSIDYKDDAALRCLSRALLKRDFDLDVSLPADRLCPTIPNRLDYILWVQDLVNATYGAHHAGPRVGLDIGTGASAVYPLLATSLMPHLHMLATELDAESLKSARANVAANPHIAQRINVLQAFPDTPVFDPLEQLHLSELDFTICNPPFYESAEEIRRLSEQKDATPSAVCTGADVEMIAAGGEVGFVSRMVEESLALPQVQWFTSLLGKHSSLVEIVSLLHAKEIDNYAVTEMQQGRTRRWAIAWSLQSARLTHAFADSTTPSLKRLLARPNMLIEALPETSPGAQHFATLLSILQEDGLRIISQVHQTLQVQAHCISWSRANRRRRKRAEAVQESLDPVLICTVVVLSPGKTSILQLSWLWGKDRQAFGSLWLHLLSRLNASSS